jgi:hypothetical protein
LSHQRHAGGTCHPRLVGWCLDRRPAEACHPCARAACDLDRSEAHEGQSEGAPSVCCGSTTDTANSVEETSSHLAREPTHRRLPAPPCHWSSAPDTIWMRRCQQLYVGGKRDVHIWKIRPPGVVYLCQRYTLRDASRSAPRSSYARSAGATCSATRRRWARSKVGTPSIRWVMPASTCALSRVATSPGGPKTACRSTSKVAP